MKMKLTRQKKLTTDSIARALKMGGTCTGEHGIGLGKKEHSKKRKRNISRRYGSNKKST